MPFIPFTIPPGVVKSDSKHSLIGRWVDCDKVRFFNGYPEKIGGFQKLSPTAFTGLARGARAWTAYNGRPNLVFGTQQDLYIYSAGALSVITPFRADANGIVLTNPFAVTSGSPTVTVTDAAHGIVDVGVTVKFTGATAVGGITVNGEYNVVSILDQNTFTITHSSSASSTTTGGGTVTAYYEINFGTASATYLTGWGVPPWGIGGWGVPASPSVSLLDDMRWWTIDTYGEDLIICPINLPLYFYDTSIGANRPNPITNSPTQVRSVFVTPERYIFALGCTRLDGSFDAMAVRWPDVDNFTDWIPTDTNRANERKLQGGSRLMAGTALTSGVSLVWSDIGVFVFQFTGSNSIYDSRLIATDCGLIGPHAFAKADGVAFWMSNNGFHMFSGYATDIPNQNNIVDWVFKRINQDQATKCFASYSKDFNEVWWVFPTTGTEPDNYVMVNLDNYEWATGTMNRTAWAKYPAGERRPIYFGTNGYIYAHDDPNDTNDDGAAMAAYIEMAPVEIENGNRTADIMGFVPDLQRQSGNLTVTLYGKDHPRDTDMMTDTLTITETDKLVDARLAGRQVGMTLTSNSVNGDFRLGKFGVEISGAGTRR